ncbi:MAG: hypothetical protein KAI43_10170 [Candidatus Aureabacteria bacterium]|nr:hypothetical protein [Candidatus Auribacterota bacterium]
MKNSPLSFFDMKCCFLLILFFALPASGDNVKQDSHILSLWQERAWQRITDRENNLPFINSEMDKEYRLDVENYAFSFKWNKKWQKEDNGFRFSFGSISRKELYNIGELKASVPFGSNSDLNISYFREESLEAKRDYLSFTVLDRDFFNTKFYSFYTINPYFEKQNIDLEIGFGKKFRSNLIQLSFGFPDLYNNVVYNMTDSIEEETYIEKPLAVRLEAVFLLSDNIEMQLFSGISNKTEKEFSFAENNKDFVESFNAGYLGASLSYFKDSYSFNLYATYQSEEESKENGNELIFNMENYLSTLGFFFDKKLSHSLNINTDIKYILTKLTVDDYEDNDILGRLTLSYAYKPKFEPYIGLLFSHRETDKHPEFDFEGKNLRLILGAEYRFNENLSGNIGMSFDIDRNDDESIYDGGKFQVIGRW